MQTTQNTSTGKATTGSTATTGQPAATATGSGSSGSVRESSTSGGGGSGLATGEMIGIIVGVLGFVATSIGVCVSCRQLKQKREERARTAGGGMPQQQPSYQMWPQHHGQHQHGKTWT